MQNKINYPQSQSRDRQGVHNMIPNIERMEEEEKGGVKKYISLCL